MMRAHRLWLLAPVLVLSGCLLPQPDTPIIPPVMPGPMAAPAQVPPETSRQTVPGPEQGAMAEPGAALTAPPDRHMANGVLTGVIKGLPVSKVVAVPESEGLALETPVRDGVFEFTLPSGTYKLDLVTADEKTLRLDRPVTIEAGANRHLAIEVKRDPLSATITEDVTLEEVVSPGPEASPAQ